MQPVKELVSWINISITVSCICYINHVLYIDNLFFGAVYSPFKGIKCMIQICQTQEKGGDVTKPLKIAQKLADPEK